VCEAEERAAKACTELAVALQDASRASSNEAELVSLRDTLQRGIEERRALEVCVYVHIYVIVLYI
jgi:hypothetical protein